MEHRAVEAALVVGDHGERRAFAHRDDAKAGRQHLDPVAMAHPHLLAAALGPKAVEERALAGDLDEGAAEFAMIGARDPPAELRAHRLLAIADAEHRHAEREDLVGRARRSMLHHRSRAAREDHGLGREGCELRIAHAERMDLSIDAALAHAPRDELGYLAAEIEDEDAVL